MQISFIMPIFLLFSDQILDGGAKVSEGGGDKLPPPPPVEESQDQCLLIIIFGQTNDKR